MDALKIIGAVLDSQDEELIRNVFDGINHYGEQTVAELLEEAREKNKKLVFYGDPDENSDKLLYKFE
jgi:hypothetical protein